MGSKSPSAADTPEIPSELAGIGFAALLEQLDSPFIAYRPNGSKAYANEAAARLCFYDSAREFMSASTREAHARVDVIDESMAPFPYDRLPAVRALLGENVPGQMLGLRRRTTGEIHWAMVKASPIPGPQGAEGMVVLMLQDVTGIKQAAIQLARTREEQAAMLEIMESACTAQDASGNLVYANAAAARLLGFTDAEALRKTDPRGILQRFDILDADRNPLPHDQLPGREALLGKTVSGKIICYRVKATGEERWSLVNAAPLFDSEGKVRLAINIFTDITEVRRAEASVAKHMRYLEGMNHVSGALQRTMDLERVLPTSLARLLEVFDCGQAWLIRADEEDTEYRIHFYAERAPKTVAPAGVSLALPVLDQVPVEAGFAEVVRACIASDDPVVFGREHPLPNQDYWRKTLGVGSLKAISMRPQVGSPWILCLLRSPDAEPWLGQDFTMFKDISARIASALGAMHLYRDLRRSEEKHRTLYERSLDGIYRCAPDGSLLDANPALVSMLGYADRAELLGTRQPLLLPAGAELAGRSEVQETFTVELTRKDGSTVWVEANAQPIRRHSGEIAYFEGIVRNINDRKRAEEALKASEEKLRQSQKMEAVGRLAGGVAHDFNNLLTAINGFSDLLLMSIGKEDGRRSHLEEIRKAGGRAAALTSQLLSFSRKQVLAPRLLDLNAVVTGMETMLRRLIGEDVALSTSLDPALHKVVADPNQMEQVILNLVLNARDAMPDGGELRLITGNRRLLEEERSQAFLDVPVGDYASLSVRDTGTGMDAETQSRLFEPFFTTKQKDKGTGLGLSTVYGAVKQANGTITVDSKTGRGTDFSIFLPAATKASRPDPVRLRERALRSAGGTETILLVEDEDAVRRLARDVLEVGGYRVLEAPGGEQALEVAEKFKDQEIHLLLTDVVMGGMSGRELAERLRAIRPTTRVLFMSGYTEDAIIRHGVYTAQAAFIGKPFSPAALSAKVREVLDATVEAKSGD